MKEEMKANEKDIRRYTASVPFLLAVELRKAGYPQDECEEGYDREGHLTSYYWKTYACPIYAQVFDWLIEKGFSIEIKCMCPKELGRTQVWYGSVYQIANAKMLHGQDDAKEFSFASACNDAIKYCLENIIVKESEK